MKYYVKDAIGNAEPVAYVDNLSPFYDDWFEFYAKSDKEAIAYCDKRQYAADEKLSRFLIKNQISSLGDFDGGACYVSNLYRVDANGEDDIRVEC